MYHYHYENFHTGSHWQTTEAWVIMRKFHVGIICRQQSSTTNREMDHHKTVQQTVESFANNKHTDNCKDVLTGCTVIY